MGSSPPGGPPQPHILDCGSASLRSGSGFCISSAGGSQTTYVHSGPLRKRRQDGMEHRRDSGGEMPEWEPREEVNLSSSADLAPGKERDGQ